MAEADGGRGEQRRGRYEPGKDRRGQPVCPSPSERGRSRATGDGAMGCGLVGRHEGGEWGEGGEGFVGEGEDGTR